MTTPEQFRAYLAGVEGVRLECKEAKRTFHFEELARYVVAIANEGGGKILFGVTDGRPRSVVGTGAFGEPGRTESGLFNRLQCRVPIEEYLHEGRRVLIVHVPSRPFGRAISDNGQYWMRAGDSLMPMSEDRLQEIHREREPDFSAEICPEVRLADLNVAAIQQFRVQWARRSGQSRITGMSDREILASAELLDYDGGVTYAAVLLFGTGTLLGRYLPQAELDFSHF